MQSNCSCRIHQYTQHRFISFLLSQTLKQYFIELRSPEPNAYRSRNLPTNFCVRMRCETH